MYWQYWYTSIVVAKYKRQVILLVFITDIIKDIIWQVVGHTTVFFISLN